MTVFHFQFITYKCFFACIFWNIWLWYAIKRTTDAWNRQKIYKCTYIMDFSKVQMFSTSLRFLTCRIAVKSTIPGFDICRILETITWIQSTMHPPASAIIAFESTPKIKKLKTWEQEFIYSKWIHISYNNINRN